MSKDRVDSWWFEKIEFWKHKKNGRDMNKIKICGNKDCEHYDASFKCGCFMHTGLSVGDCKNFMGIDEWLDKEHLKVVIEDTNLNKYK